MLLFILNEEEQVLATLNEEAIFVAKHNEKLNGPHHLELSLDGTNDIVKHVKEGHFIAFHDTEDDFQLFEIKLIEDVYNDKSVKSVTCEHTYMELADEFVTEYRPQSTAKDALEKALIGTRWKMGEVADLGISNTSFYHESPVSAISKIPDAWGGELRQRVTLDEAAGITGRYLDLLTRRSMDTGKVIRRDKDMLEIIRTLDLTELKTAMRGYGKGLETGDGFGRKITFADVEWKIANGDPANKPKGQDWVGDEHARIAWGRRDNGSSRHRFGIFEDMEEEDSAKLLRTTWDYLQSVKQPIINYKLTMLDFRRISGYEHERVVLGDTVGIIDDEMIPVIEVKARAIEIERDLLDPANDQLTFGQYLPLFNTDNDDLQKIVDRVKNSVGRWDSGGDFKIDPSKYPDIIPSVPANLEAIGAYGTIQLYWDFNINEIYVSAYELYASEIPNFVMSPENLVYRGILNGFNYIAQPNKQFYFRVRAVNYHGRFSAFSSQVSATTARVVTEDILFGPELAEKLRELNKEADIIGVDGVDLDKIQQGVFDKIESDRKRYTDQEIAHVENALNQELRDRAKVEDVNREINRINKDIGDGKESLNKVAEDLQGMDEHFKAEFEVLETGLSGKISTGEVDRLLGDKVDLSVYDRRQADIDFSIDGFKTSFEQANTRIDNVSGEIVAVEQRTTSIEASNEGFLVDIIELKNQEIGGRNILLESKFVQNFSNNNTYYPVDTNQHNSYVSYSPRSTANRPIINLYNNLRAQEFITDHNWSGRQLTASLMVRINKPNLQLRIRLAVDTFNPNTINQSNIDLEEGSWTKVHTTSPINGIQRDLSNDDRARIFVGVWDSSINNWAEGYDLVLDTRDWQIEFGDKATSWAMAPEEMVDLPTYTSRQTQLDTTINGITGRVGSTESGLNGLRDTQSKFQLDLNGFSTSVDEIRTNVGIGGKNLIKDGDKEVSSNAYIVNHYDLTEDAIERNKTFTMSAKLTITGGAGQRSVGIWANRGTGVRLGLLELDSDGIYKCTFTVNASITAPRTISLYQLPNDSNRGTVKVEWVKLERGSQYTGFSLSPEDTLSRMTSFESTLSGINGRVSTTESSLTGVTNRIGTLELTSVGFNTKISDLEKIETGGQNLARRTELDFTSNSNHADSVVTVNRNTVVSEWNTNEAVRIRSTGGTNSIKAVISALTNTEKIVGHAYTLSVWVKNNASSALILHTNDGGSTTVPANGIGRFYVTWIANTNSHIQLQLRGNSSATNIDALLWRVQLEEGNKMSGYKPPSYGTGGFMDRISKSETAIEQNATAITQRATVTSVDNLTGRMSTAEGRITTQAGQIDLKVSRDGIVSAINITPESIRINGSLIRITGQTVIDSAVIKSLHIENGAVGNLAIANASITAAKLQNAIITNAHIADATIQSAKIANVSADKINAGTIRGINITGVTVTGSTITSDSGNNYTTIRGGYLESSGRYRRTWQGVTRTTTVETRLMDGHIRFRDQQASQSLFLSSFGISTFMDGEGEYQDLPGSSGTIAWWDTTYSPGNANGITMSSYGGAVGLKSDLSHVVIDSGQSAQITSRNSVVYINPKTSKAGNNNFWFNLLDNTNDGFQMYGSLETQPNVGLRYSKAGNTISVVDGNYNRGGNTGFDVGTVYTNNIYKRESNTTVYWNGTSGGSTSINAPGDILRASGIRANTGSSDIFLATNDGAVRVTDGNGFNEGRGISYRPIAVERVASMSSIKFKENIEVLGAVGLEIINALQIVSYDLKTNPNAERQVGLIAEYSSSVAMLDHTAIDQYKLTSYNTKAIQELDFKVENVVDELSILRIENQLMKKRIAKLEGKTA